MTLTVDALDHLVINVKDVETAAVWYERVLGMKRVVTEPRPGAKVTSMHFGRQKINLRPVGALAEDPEWVTGTVEAAGSEDLCFITRCTPDEVRAQLIDCGVKITSGPVIKTGALGPMTSHYCRDIDGNLIEIAVY